ncbi:trehalose-phosphatase [Chelativorans sp. AA-79]|uniref:trehalose-phosphatase n=1 Tax=Chelativorans sp. AA-79 TaxID=3028735 RepID=UPI0023F94455|nr:trehalose-phosphatase [Chelativorans sp. AA-79]WEX11415.1 trehalose-phosphatase [Chelativorans sp. AA-79]
MIVAAFRTLIHRDTMAGEAAPLSSLDYAGLKPAATAIFLDFDGTLADLAERPDEVSVPAATRAALERLVEATQGALAIVTGRPIDDIDHYLAPLRLPVAGVHGLERRTAAGARMTAAVDEEKFASVRGRLQAFVDAHPGLLLETKRGSMALHYRQRPELGDASIAAVHEAVNGSKGFHLLHGKMVIEVKGGKATKADALAAFMQEEPFCGRVPVFAGDDVTDEDAFRRIAVIKGISIKIGGGSTAALFRTEGTASFREWLGQLADSFDSRDY